jgi:ABC-2 type transport system ATP-binding protein
VFLDEPTAALDPEAAFVVREAIEDLRRAGRTIVLATHNLDEADRLCDRVAFVRGGLLRVDSPARLRGSLAGGQVEVRFADRPSEDLIASARSVDGVAGARLDGDRLVVEAPDPAAITPALIRALVDAGASILEVRPAASSLESVYFEVMGVRPGAGGEAA